MPGGDPDSSLTRVQPFFLRLLARDPTGRTWLAPLLAATSNGRARLGSLLENPGGLYIALAAQTVSGQLSCFEYPVAPSRELLAWFIDNPDRLRWPEHCRLSRETVRLRRALIYDEPAGVRPKAQERARELLGRRSALSASWWRFEGVSKIDCVLITDRLVVTVAGKRTEPLGPATDWYPQRSQLVRTLEAARELAEDKRWASLLLSETPRLEGTREHLKGQLPEAAPHLDSEAREELHAGYLGNLTWRAACEAVGLPFEALPDSTDDLRRRLRAAERKL